MRGSDRIARIRLRGVTVQLRRPIIARLITVRTARLLLLDLETAGGVQGRSYVHMFGPPEAAMAGDLIRTLAHELIGKKLAPRALHAGLLRRFGLYDGSEGALLGAIAALDMACWDAAARAADLPLAVYLGGETTPLRAYHSCGLGLLEPSALIEDALSMIAETGVSAMKMRLGRAEAAADVVAVRALRRNLPDSIDIMSDATQSFDAIEATHRLLALDGEGLYWIEDPLYYKDFAGHARLARSLRTPVQTGENFDGARMVGEAIRHEAADCINFDMRHIGGVTGWLDAAPLAAVANLPLSSHMYPEFSAHMLAVSPSRHWLEYMDWATPILRRPVLIEGGHFIFPDSPGVGMEWDEDALRRFGAEEVFEACAT